MSCQLVLSEVEGLPIACFEARFWICSVPQVPYPIPFQFILRPLPALYYKLPTLPLQTSIIARHQRAIDIFLYTNGNQIL